MHRQSHISIPQKLFSVAILTLCITILLVYSCDKDKEKSIVGPGEDTYTISGRVIQDDGTIISNIFVTIIGTSIKETTIIDRWGTFSFEGLPTGDYILTPFNGGFQKYKFYPSNKEIRLISKPYTSSELAQALAEVMGQAAAG